MKKISILLVAVLLAGCMMAGCGNSGGEDKNAGQENTNNQTDNKKENEVVNNGFSFTYKGTEIKINAPMSPIVDELGDPDDYFESESCAFQGLDKVYTYGGVVISTYPEEKADYVYSIELKDDTVETPEGIYIGVSKDDVKAAYGTPDSETETAFIYTKDKSQLNIMFEGDAVTSIVYVTILE